MIILVVIATMVGCTVEHRYATEEEVLALLRRELPDKNFEITNYQRYVSGIGPYVDSIRIRYTIQCVDTGVSFATHRGHGADYVNAVWGGGVSRWRRGFQEFFEKTVASIYPSWIPRESSYEAHLSMRSGDPYDNSPNNLYFVLADREFVEQTIENNPTFEILLLNMASFEMPMNMRFSASFHVYMDEFNLEYELERIHNFFRGFVLPLQEYSVGRTENQVMISINITFGADDLGRMAYRVSDFLWEYRSWVDNERLSEEKLIEYDFSGYFSRWENGRIIEYD